MSDIACHYHRIVSKCKLPTWCLLHILVHATLFPCLVNITRNDLVLRFNRNQSIFQMLLASARNSLNGMGAIALPFEIFVLYCIAHLTLGSQTGIFVIKILNEYILCKLLPSTHPSHDDDDHSVSSNP